VLQTDWVANATLQLFFIRSVGEMLDDVTQEYKIGVAILSPFPRLKTLGLAGDDFHHLLACLRVLVPFHEGRIACETADTALMRQHLTDGDFIGMVNFRKKFG
jgi:hypothetical protein